MKKFNDITGCIQEINLNINDGFKIFLLEGDLSSGKTYLVQQFFNKFKNKHGDLEHREEKVTSPSFTFINQYFCHNLDIFHYDLYLKNDLDSKIILIDNLTKEGIHFIEWGDLILKAKLENLGFKVLLIRINIIDQNRIYIFEF